MPDWVSILILLDASLLESAINTEIANIQVSILILLDASLLVYDRRCDRF